MGIISSIVNVGKKVVDVVAGGVINFVKSPSIKTAVPAAVDVATTLIPVGKVAKVATPAVKVAAPVVSKSVVPAVTGAIKTVVRTATGVVKSVIPSSTSGKVAAVVAAPVVVGIVSSAPKETAKAAIEAPSELAKFGSDIGQLIKEPSIANVKELVKESPIITALATAVVGGSAVKAAIPAISGILTKEAIEEQTEVLKSIAIPSQVPTSSKEVASPAGSASLVPTTPQTQNLITSTTETVSTRKRKKKVQKAINISNRLNVLIDNRSRTTNKRYLNKLVVLK